MRIAPLLALALLVICACGCDKHEEPLDLSQQKPDAAEQIAAGEQPSGSDMAKKAAEGG